jgi:Xaa-Pro aminopeptidase
VDHELRRRAIGERLGSLGVEAVLITELVNVRYLTGFTGSNGQLLLTAEGATFLTDGRYTEQARHEAPGPTHVTYRRTYRDDLPGLVDGVGRLGFEAHAVTVDDHGKLAGCVEGVELVALTDLVERGRRVKDAEELELLRRAQAATDGAFDRVLDAMSVGTSERRTARDLERLLLDEGADDLAFDPIVAFGENAAEPHHEPGHRMLEEGDVIKLDFGARVQGYHADMTRTVAFGSAPTQLRKIHDVVRQAQEAGIDAVRAGVTGAEVDAAARGVIADAGYGDRFVHGLGHGVGLRIHEAPWLGVGQENELPAGAVVTVEPGIYVPGIGGVRIEDMVEVTDDGCRVLGTSSRELIEL